MTQFVFDFFSGANILIDDNLRWLIRLTLKGTSELLVTNLFVCKYNWEFNLNWFNKLMGKLFIKISIPSRVNVYKVVSDTMKLLTLISCIE